MRDGVFEFQKKKKLLLLFSGLLLDGLFLCRLFSGFLFRRLLCNFFLGLRCSLYNFLLRSFFLLSHFDAS